MRSEAATPSPSATTERLFIPVDDKDTSEGSAAWRHHYMALRRFAMKNGHCHVPYRQRVSGVNLYAWAARQRSRRTRLTRLQQRQLEALPGWAWNFRDDAWFRSYEALARYASREGTCQASRSHVEDGIAVGRWLSAQRMRLHRLDPEHRRLLEALPGWATDPRSQRWWDCHRSVVHFAQKFGHARVPHGLTFEGRNLGLWVARQRWLYRQERLSAERMAALEAVPGWCWNPGEIAPGLPSGRAW